MIARELLLAQCRSMILLLNTRLGDVNPWADFDLDSLNDQELSSIKKLMHELLYSPPPPG